FDKLGEVVIRHHVDVHEETRDFHFVNGMRIGKERLTLEVRFVVLAAHGKSSTRDPRHPFRDRKGWRGSRVDDFPWAARTTKRTSKVSLSFPIRIPFTKWKSRVSSWTSTW